MFQFHTFHAKHRQLNQAAGILALIALWLLLHPYLGLYHDARIYIAQALYRLQPETFKLDLFFRYGSQDQFTIFSLIYADALEFLGLERGIYLLTLAGQLLWLGAAFFLASSLASGFVLWLTLLLLTTLPGYYGSENILVFGEGFLTSRVYAEAISLAGIACAVREKWSSSAALILLALLLHPLMALSALLTVLLYRYSLSKELCILALAGVMVVALAAWADIAPFDRLLLTMDGEWREIVLRDSPWLALENWEIADWALWAVGESTLMLVWLSSADKLKRLFFAVLVVSLLSTLLAFVGGSVFKNALLLQIQLWRALWIMQWFACFALAWFAGEHWHKSEFAKVVILVLLSAWLMRGHGGGLVAALTIPAWIWQQKNAIPISLPRSIRLGAYLLLIQALIWFALDAIANYQLLDVYDNRAVGVHGFFDFGSGAVLIPMWLMGRRFFASARPQWLSIAACFVSVMALAAIVAGWDNRRSGDFPRPIESADEFAEFRQFIPKNSTVYWEGSGAMYVWLLLNRPSYLSGIQTAGIIFNKQTALEGFRRAKNVWPLSQEDSRFFLLANPNAELARKKSPVDRNDLAAVCQDPILDFVVYSKPILDARPVAVRKEQATQRLFFLYDCKTMRSR